MLPEEPLHSEDSWAFGPDAQRKTLSCLEILWAWDLLGEPEVPLLAFSQLLLQAPGQRNSCVP
jgi:hypothetical protein